MSMTLYEISAQYRDALRTLEAADLAQQVVKDTLEGLEGALEVKAVNVAAFLQNLEAEARAIKAAEQRMVTRRKSIEAKVESLKEYLRFNMERCGIAEIRSPEFILKLKKNPPAVVIDDASAIPDWFKRETITVEINKRAIKEAIQQGEIVPGAYLNNSIRLEIR